MEVVGGSRVVVVVDNRGEEQGEDLQVRQPILQPGLRDEPVRRLNKYSFNQQLSNRIFEN